MRAKGLGSCASLECGSRGGGMGTNERSWISCERRVGPVGRCCCNRSIWEMKVSRSLGDDAYLSMPKRNTVYRTGIGCLDRSTGSVYTVARCGCHDGGRNRVFSQSRYVTCKTRR